MAADDIYVRHAPLLRHIAVHKFHVPLADADSLVHDVFISYLARPDQVRQPRPYLIGAICNASRHYWRERKNEEAALGSADFEFERPEEAILDVVGRKILISTMLARIGRQCRDLLRRYYLLGETTARIAEGRNTTPDYILFLLHRCRRSAREIVRSLLEI